ncbi:hypothetical protein niasHS_007255 [Heterodera schachtii]|uniref:ANK_REP_REGION domain-containing protein n=1 Tax=Heterodera schachtii TaxID=97005 RepID=A0ABD2JJY7_HETSC
MDSPSSVKAGLKKSVFLAIKGTDRLLRPNNANVRPQLQGVDNAKDCLTPSTTGNNQPTREQPKLMDIDERIGVDDEDNDDGDRFGEAAEVLGGGDNANRVGGERVVGNRLRKRRSVSCEPTANSPAKMAPHQTADDQSAGCLLQRTQSVNAFAVPSAHQQNAVVPIASSSRISSRMPSSVSICSYANSEVSARKRSPSGDGSLCSKEERSLSSTIPKISISICGKALYACASGRLDDLAALLKEHPELVNYQYPYCYRYSCLHIAAKAGDSAIVRFLVKNGAKLNAKDNWSTPLHLAAQAGHLEMTRQLREMGADPALQDAHGKHYYDYLPADNRKLFQNATPKRQKTPSIKNAEDSDSVSSSQSQLSLSLHHRFETFRKPIGRAVSDFLHRK